MRKIILGIINVASLLLFIVLLPQYLYSQDWYDLRGGAVKKTVLNVNQKPPAPLLQITAMNNAGSVTKTVKDIKRYRIQFSPSGFMRREKTINNSNFVELRMPDCSQQCTDLGKPAVPVKTVTIPIPAGQKPVVNVHNVQEKEIVVGKVIPAQPPEPESEIKGEKKPFVIDSDQYASNAQYPADHIFSTSVVKMRNHRFLTIILSPVRALSGSGTVKVATTLDVEVLFEKDISPENTVEDNLSDPIGFDRFLLEE